MSLFPHFVLDGSDPRGVFDFARTPCLTRGMCEALARRLTAAGWDCEPPKPWRRGGYRFWASRPGYTVEVATVLAVARMLRGLRPYSGYPLPIEEGE
jgi:hypothetical protein